MSTPQTAAAYISAVETRLETLVHAHTNEDILAKSMLYSLEAGGKRIRPLLLLSTVLLYTDEISDAAIDVAAALEMMHTYSLIHDDLPAMDDDDLRRGKPTNHKVFGEDIAILAGDALLTLAFQVVAQTPLPAVVKIDLLTLLAQTAGPTGMVAGQVADMQAEQQQVSLLHLQAIHERKTGELIRFAILAGAMIEQAPTVHYEQLDQLARKIGLAFQIRDDILDVTSTTEALGKTAHRDEVLEKSTYPKLLGLSAAKEALRHELHTAQAILVALAESGLNDQPLQAILTQLALQEEA